MRTKTRLALTSLAILAVAAVARPGTLDTSPGADVVGALEGYTSWQRVTREPFRVSPAINAACAPAVPARTNPHEGAFITVFVNATGRTAMFTPGEVVFPEGTVIVKEKRKDDGSGTPDLMTVMVKRERGYDPAVGDWEFAVVDGTGTRVTEHGKLADCAGCHTSVSKTDFVFRSYLAAAK